MPPNTPTAQGRVTPSADALARCGLANALGSDRLLELVKYLTVQNFSPGERILRQGGTDRDLYFVLSGEARIVRQDLEVGIVGEGGHFGELGLLAEAPRAASVEAHTALTAARLGPSEFEALGREKPHVALALLQRLVGDLRERLTEMTESVGDLLSQRSLPHRTHLKVRVDGTSHDVRTGTPAGELLPEMVDDHRVVAALIDRQPVSLVWPLTSDCTVTPLTTAHWEGERIFRQSLALLLLEAAHRVFPEALVSMEHSIGFGRRVSVKGAVVDLETAAARLQAEMGTLADRDRVLHEDWWTVEVARAHFAALGWTSAVELLGTFRHPAVSLQSYGHVHALRTCPLVPRTGALRGFSVVADGEGLLLMYGRDARRASQYPGEIEAAVEARAASKHALSMTTDLERWLQALRITSVGDFNRISVEGNVSELIRVAEGFQEKRIGSIADEIRAKADEVRVVCVAGPSSSGKTTFIRRLRVQLQVNGFRPVGLSLDDYYVDRENTPLDRNGVVDYEAFEALGVDLFQDHLAQLLDGKRVRTAHYDFKEGKSHPDGGSEIMLEPRDILLVEGIHGLNPLLSDRMGDHRLYRVFICPLTQLPFDRCSRVHASDVRLIRRIVRDRHSRGAHAADNILRWPSVRRGERRHIFPFQSQADAVVDSSLLYELSVLKVFAERYLLEVPHSHEAYPTAHRLLRLLDHFVTLYPEHVPPTSLLREFIGGSGFDY